MFQEGVVTCWRCGAQIKVYTWPGHSMWPKVCPEEGRPATVKRMTSVDVPEGYWANTCGRCGVIQGDWYLYAEPEGPFFGQNSA